MITIELKSILGKVIFIYDSKKEKVEATKDAVRAILKEFIAKEEQIKEIDLSNMDLSGVDFDNSSFDNSRFDNSRFDNSRFYNSSFYNSSFDNSRFENSSFYNSRFENSSFYNSRFDNSRFDNSRFYNSSFDNSRFYNSIFYNSSFDNSRFDDKTIKLIRKAGQLKMFDIYKNDFWIKLLKLKKEIPAFKKVLKEGRIDGTCYEGECACFCGTLANLMKISHKKLPGIVVDSSSPVEVWFTMIKKGMSPDNSEIARLTMEWIEELETYLK